MPVVAASEVPDMVAMRITGPMVRSQPTARYRGMWTRWSSHSSSGPMVIAMEGSTQSLWPAAMTMTGRTNAATNSITVAVVQIARSGSLLDLSTGGRCQR